MDNEQVESPKRNFTSLKTILIALVALTVIGGVSAAGGDKHSDEAAVQGLQAVAVSPSPTVQPTPTATPAPTVSPTPKPTPQPTIAPVQTQISAPCGTYINSAGHRVPRPCDYDSAPSGATAKCADGTYSYSESRRGTCSHHGGVAKWLQLSLYGED